MTRRRSATREVVTAVCHDTEPCIVDGIATWIADESPAMKETAH